MKQLIEDSRKILLGETYVVPSKLISDIASLKKLGWKTDRIIQQLITSDDYGKGLTSDIIRSIAEPPKAPKVKVYKEPVPKFPNDPTGYRKNSAGHAEGYLGSYINAEHYHGGSIDITYSEAQRLLKRVGYSDEAIEGALNNMGLTP